MRQRENLKSARVGQHGAIPTHETVDAAGAPENFRARPQQQVIGVGEQNLRARIFERAGQLRLHRRLRADRHEERRLHFVVQSAKGRRPAHANRLACASRRKFKRDGVMIKWAWTFLVILRREDGEGPRGCGSRFSGSG